MYSLGIDIGTSSVKVSVIDLSRQLSIASAQFPEQEAPIKTLQTGWAEQNPADWWAYTQQAILKLNATGKFNPKAIKCIGIAYQMHGLVMADKNQNILRDSIIWCDSRAVPYGEKAFATIGEQECLTNLLNSPGNFTAAKLAWVKQNEPHVYHQIDKIMLPGDFIAMKLTGEVTTSIAALSEGVFWDFRSNTISSAIMDHFGFSSSFIPQIKDVFSQHGLLQHSIASQLGLSAGIPISYKAGDQPNNALSLNVLQPGEVAATAGTSGVIYGVSDHLAYDKQSRVNTFAHVNYTPQNPLTGMLLCINGTGSMYRWAKHTLAPQLSYSQMNQLAETSPIGSKNLLVLPFGNGAERMLHNQFTGAQVANIDLNTHQQEDIFRAVIEGIAFSFRYGLDIMRENGLAPSVIKAGKANLFQSELFAQTFVDVTGIPVQLYHNDGSTGAAFGAAIGAQFYKSAIEAFENVAPIARFEPANTKIYQHHYQNWHQLLNQYLENHKIA